MTHWDFSLSRENSSLLARTMKILRFDINIKRWNFFIPMQYSDKNLSLLSVLSSRHFIPSIMNVHYIAQTHRKLSNSLQNYVTWTTDNNPKMPTIESGKNLSTMAA